MVFVTRNSLLMLIVVAVTFGLLAWKLTDETSAADGDTLHVSDPRLLTRRQRRMALATMRETFTGAECEKAAYVLSGSVSDPEVLLLVAKAPPKLCLHLRAQAAYRLLMQENHREAVPIILDLLEKDKDIGVQCDEHSGARLRGLIWDYTFYRDPNLKKMRSWWKAHRNESRTEWARQAVNAALDTLEKCKTREEEFGPRLHLYRATRFSRIHRIDLDTSVAVFRTWWKKMEGKSRNEWLKDSLDGFIRRFAAGDGYAWQEICMLMPDEQLMSITGLNLLELTRLPAMKKAVQKDIVRKMQKWWAKNRETWRYTLHEPGYY